MSDSKDVLRFTVSAKDAEIMKGILIVAFISAMFCTAVFLMITFDKPDYEEVPFSINEDDIEMVEITLQEGDTIYYKVECDYGVHVIVMTETEYEDMINGDVFSYIEDQWSNNLETETEALEAGNYILLVKGGTDGTTGTLYYANSVDKSDQAIFWIGMFPGSILIGWLIWLFYGIYADHKFSKLTTGN